MMYKDRPEVNQQNEFTFLQVLHEEALWLKKYHEEHEDKKKLKEEFLPRSAIKLSNGKEPKEHYPKHNGCSSIRKQDSTKLTEKRICRCMYYYKDTSKKCLHCLLETKWRNIGNIQITNYEWPTKHVYKNVGGMDLILDNTYAVEVKPQGSTETLTRMFAEIMTYTLDCAAGYKPAICFFENSQQMKDFEKYRNNPDLQFIIKFIKVFYFKIIKTGSICEFEIKPYN